MVIRYLICFVALLVVCSPVHAEPGSGIRIPTKNFSIVFAPADSSIAVTIDLSLVNPDSDSSAALLFSPRAEISGMRWLVGAETLAANYRRLPPETLAVTIPGQELGEPELTLQVTYRYPVQVADSGLILLDRGHRWYPLIADNIALCNLKIEVPKDWFAVTGGDLVSADTTGELVRSVWQSRIPMFKVMLGIGRTTQYVEFTQKSEQTNLHLLCQPGDSGSARGILQEAAKAFGYFSREIGPYAHSRLTLLETRMFPGANLGTSIIALGADMIAPIDRGGDAMLDLAVASQWFGAGVFGRFQDEGFWFITLSLPHYERLLYLRDTQGEEAFLKDLNRGLDRYRQFAGTAGDIPILQVDYLNTQEKGNVVAFKGPYLLEHVRRMIGPEAWEQFIMRLYETWQGEILTCQEFLGELVLVDPMAGSWLTSALSETGLPQE
ncbi:hypothetical protein C3F09_05040 [candidate division GN15 bacterium]|uniref:Peptidase M1 membrane alanine aminopeptidase domain-containing protein n=1 Tax=candidate division GN15 bacterium TaxID=2072418 RepID=A0A855X4H2_9BACT|nr:MAG: hypothetical protein C3F09_05040 [candidate division GN15 bacterium]